MCVCVLVCLYMCVCTYIFSFLNPFSHARAKSHPAINKDFSFIHSLFSFALPPWTSSTPEFVKCYLNHLHSWIKLLSGKDSSYLECRVNKYCYISIVTSLSIWHPVAGKFSEQPTTTAPGTSLMGNIMLKFPKQVTTSVIIGGTQCKHLHNHFDPGHKGAPAFISKSGARIEDIASLMDIVALWTLNNQALAFWQTMWAHPWLQRLSFCMLVRTA